MLSTHHVCRSSWGRHDAGPQRCGTKHLPAYCDEAWRPIVISDCSTCEVWSSSQSPEFSCVLLVRTESGSNHSSPPPSARCLACVRPEHRFADIPFPTSEDWEAATGKVFPKTFSHQANS